MLTLVVTETLRSSWPRGAAVALGPLLADWPIIALTLFALARVPPEIQTALSLGGGLFLLYLAVTTALHSKHAQLPPHTAPAIGGGLLKGFLARALSPNPYLFWGLVGAPILVRADTWSAVAFLIGYYATIVGSNVALALALQSWITRISARTYQWLLRLAAIILAAYGVLLLDRARR